MLAVSMPSSLRPRTRRLVLLPLLFRTARQFQALGFRRMWGPRPPALRTSDLPVPEPLIPEFLTLGDLTPADLTLGSLTSADLTPVRLMPARRGPRRSPQWKYPTPSKLAPRPQTRLLSRVSWMLLPFLEARPLQPFLAAMFAYRNGGARNTQPPPRLLRGQKLPTASDEDGWVGGAPPLASRPW